MTLFKASLVLCTHQTVRVGGFGSTFPLVRVRPPAGFPLPRPRHSLLIVPFCAHGGVAGLCVLPRRRRSVPLAMLLYWWSLLVAFMALTVHLYPQLTITELAFAAIPVGAVGGAWLFFLITLLLNFLGWVSLDPGCVSALCASAVALPPCPCWDATLTEFARV